MRVLLLTVTGSGAPGCVRVPGGPVKIVKCLAMLCKTVRPAAVENWRPEILSFEPIPQSQCCQAEGMPKRQLTEEQIDSIIISQSDLSKRHSQLEHVFQKTQADLEKTHADLEKAAQRIEVQVLRSHFAEHSCYSTKCCVEN